MLSEACSRKVRLIRLASTMYHTTKLFVGIFGFGYLVKDRRRITE